MTEFHIMWDEREEWKARALKAEEALREIDGWLNGDHVSTVGDVQRAWKEAGAIARNALEVK